MGDGGISPKNAGMGVIGGWGYFKRDGGISNQEDTMNDHFHFNFKVHLII